MRASRPGPAAWGPFRGPGADDLGTALAQQGFSDVRVEEPELPLVFEGGIGQVLATLAASPVAATVSELGVVGRAELWKAGERRLSTFRFGRKGARVDGVVTGARLALSRTSVHEPQFGLAGAAGLPVRYARDLSESQPMKETTSVGSRTPLPQGLG